MAALEWCSEGWVSHAQMPGYSVFHLQFGMLWAQEKRGPVKPQMRCLAFQLYTPFYVSRYIEPIHLPYDYHVQY